ncbi:uncharacterized protein [Narcine bancroftii]|uniref:uncharacterized protein n=1 Tax=Narcine bancroftii TaxID=1343680 RepID=UPI003831A167
MTDVLKPKRPVGQWAAILSVEASRCLLIGGDGMTFLVCGSPRVCPCELCLLGRMRPSFGMPSTAVYRGAHARWSGVGAVKAGRPAAQARGDGIGLGRKFKFRAGRDFLRGRDMSTLYIEAVAEHGNCLQRLSFFVRRELKIFGITEIIIGIAQITFGLPLNFTEQYMLVVLIGVPWWTGIWYIIAGSLVVDIINTSNTHLKQVIALTHIISTVAATTAAGAYFISIYLMPPLNNFFIFQPVLLLLFLMVLCVVELVVASLILFLHCVLITQEIQLILASRHSLSQH